MKKFLFMALSAMMMTACGGGSNNNNKTLTPAGSEFKHGEIAKYVEVVDEPAEFSYAEQEDGWAPKQIFTLKVKMRLAKACNRCQGVNPHDIGFTGLLSVATIDLLDENGTKVQDIDVKNSLELKKLLCGNEGDEAIITFEGEFHNSDGAPKWFSKTTQFEPGLSGDICINN